MAMAKIAVAMGGTRRSPSTGSMCLLLKTSMLNLRNPITTTVRPAPKTAVATAAAAIRRSAAGTPRRRGCSAATRSGVDRVCVRGDPGQCGVAFVGGGGSRNGASVRGRSRLRRGRGNGGPTDCDGFSGAGCAPMRASAEARPRLNSPRPDDPWSRRPRVRRPWSEATTTVAAAVVVAEGRDEADEAEALDGGSWVGSRTRGTGRGGQGRGLRCMAVEVATAVPGSVATAAEVCLPPRGEDGGRRG